MQRLLLILTATAMLVAVPPLDARSAPPEVSTREVGLSWAGPASAPAATSPAWRISVVVSTPDARMLGVVAQDGRPVAVQVRTRDANGWSDWTALTWMDEAPDEGTAEAEGLRTVTDPLSTGEIEAVQVRTAAERPRLGLELVDVRGGEGWDPLAPPPGSAGAAQAPAIVPRSTWDPNGSCEAKTSSFSYSKRLDFSVVHHTATRNTYTAAEAAAELLAICEYHTEARGFYDLGYHLVVDRFGVVYEGRKGGVDTKVMGAHAAGANENSFGISVMGCFDPSCDVRLGKTGFPDAARDAVDRTLAWKFVLHSIPAEGSVTSPAGERVARINGHREVGTTATACPGRAVFRTIKRDGTRVIADRVAALMPTYAPTWRPPLIGDAQRGTRDDVATYNPATGDHLLARSTTAGTFVREPWSRTRLRSGWGAQALVDATGDGRGDVVAFHRESSRWQVGLSDGKRFVRSWWGSYPSGRTWRAHRFGDPTGDGLADIISVESTGALRVARSTGTQFRSRVWGVLPFPTGWVAHLTGFADADVATDLVSVRGRGVWVARATPDRTFTVERWGTLPHGSGWDGFQLGDVDGDGLDDVVAFHADTGQWWAAISTGTSFDVRVWGTPLTPGAWDASVMLDVDGNGTQDVVTWQEATKTWWLHRSTGVAFTSAPWLRIRTAKGWQWHRAADVDGDGLDELVSFHGAMDSFWVTEDTTDGAHRYRRG